MLRQPNGTLSDIKLNINQTAKSTDKNDKITGNDLIGTIYIYGDADTKESFALKDNYDMSYIKHNVTNNSD